MPEQFLKVLVPGAPAPATVSFAHLLLLTIHPRLWREKVVQLLQAQEPSSLAGWFLIAPLATSGGRLTINPAKMMITEGVVWR